MKYLTLLITMLLLYACGNGGHKQNAETIAEQTSQPELIPINENTEPTNDSISTSKSLNDIRFGNWTDKDWYDNDYLRFLRQTFNDFLAGKIEREDFIPYKSLLHSKFIIGEVEKFLLGGLYVYIVFIDAPDKVFTTNIYSDVDEVSGVITGYEVRTLRLHEEESGLTKKMILELIKEHPENKLW